LSTNADRSRGFVQRRLPYDSEVGSVSIMDSGKNASLRSVDTRGGYADAQV